MKPKSIILSFAFVLSLSIILPAQSLQIWMINVGQGDAILVKSDTAAMLIDAGQYKAARDTIFALLKKQNIRHLDYFVASHYDADHIGQAEYILDSIPARVVYDRGEEGAPNTQAYQQYVAAAGTRRQTIQFGQSFRLGSSVVYCVAVDGRWSKSGKLTQNDDENNRSVGLLIKSGRFWMLSAGDISSPTEDSIALRAGDINILKVGHHGSKYSSTGYTLAKLKPEIALISVGHDNSYGHPTAGAIGRIDQSGTVKYIYQTTDGCGAGSGSSKSKITGTVRIDVYDYYYIMSDGIRIDNRKQVIKSRYPVPPLKMSLD